jgi:pyrroline-5-carboxylate reductase
MIDKKIGIIGGGNMGEAIFSHLANVLEKSTMLKVSEMDASKRESLQTKYRIIVEIDNNALVKFADVIIIAVKPQDAIGLLSSEVCCGVSKDKLVISVAAGITTGHIEDTIGKDIPVIRAMPNMAARVGEAVTSISPGKAAGKDHMKLAKDIFSVIGTVVEVDEKLVDAVTAISGSGPAYFFYLMECLMDAALEMGIDKETAQKLVMQTALGSAKLAEALMEHPEVLRKKVTSRGGTTEAAFKIFEKKNFKEIIVSAVEEARKRSKELSGR